MNISAKVTKHEENLIFAFFLTFPQGKISRKPLSCFTLQILHD